ncbi:deoxyuridine 5'-triphosphate nucleotidohydrolase [Vibrio phage henriette 12B8]|uniref:dUTPase n=1 Tax=Vibrio phage henriette 12B8 TaxID=573174 RepID=UPI0002C08B66|nr:dUTPase [Vibrio phage henriette 12B8]AGG58187.1 deoxyuridine 5'-triphosphate nucleotidohydrolase [Vibrio phage henriette 12B8]
MNKNIEMKIVNEDTKLFDTDGVPRYATKGSAAFDLRAMFNKLSPKLKHTDTGDIELQPNESVLIPTGIAININDPSFAAIVLPRSSVGAKRGLLARLYEFDVTDPLGLLDNDGKDDPVDVGNICGLIDSDYQGEIFVSVWNRSDDIQYISYGERIAQLMFTPVIRPAMHVVDKFTPIESVNLKQVGGFSTTTERGEGGLGSTGKK